MFIKYKIKFKSVLMVFYMIVEAQLQCVIDIRPRRDSWNKNIKHAKCIEYLFLFKKLYLFYLILLKIKPLIIEIIISYWTWLNLLTSHFILIYYCYAFFLNRQEDPTMSCSFRLICKKFQVWPLWRLEKVVISWPSKSGALWILASPWMPELQQQELYMLTYIIPLIASILLP